MRSSGIFVLATSVSGVFAITERSFRPRAPLPTLLDARKSHGLLDSNGSTLPPLDTIYYFDQLIDHNDPSKGTFKQRYWHNYEFYEPGAYLLGCNHLRH